MLYGTTKKVLNKYQTLQNMCAKLVLGKSKIWQCITNTTTATLATGTGKDSSQNTLIHKCIYGQASGYLKKPHRNQRQAWQEYALQ